MRIWINKTLTPPVLFLEPENDHERMSFEALSGLNEPLTAIRKGAPDFFEAHMEIRKEKQ